VLLGPHVGAEGDPEQEKGDLEQDRKGLHDSIKIPCDDAIELLLSALRSFLL
jgi:hypothetical protein